MIGRRGGPGHPGAGRGQPPLRLDMVALSVDLLAMAVAAGLTPFLAIEMVVRFGPPPVADRLEVVLAATTEAELRLADALDCEAACTPALAPVLGLLAASE